MKRHSSHSHRGLGTVVVNGMLLAAVASLGVVTLSFANSTLSGGKDSLESAYATNHNKINENLMVENIWFGQIPTKYVNITIDNVGGVGLNVTQIKITNSTSVWKNAVSNGELLPSKSYNWQKNYSWTDNQILEIEITTARDLVYKVEAKP